MNENAPACSGPFGGATIDYPVHFDLRIIYILAEAPDMEGLLKAALASINVPCSMIQGIAKPGAKYGRMGARVTIESQMKMNTLYAEVAKIPGVKAVI
ncbi:MAG: hypothetical protein WBH66_02925 [Rectinemataceae bacterium]